MNKLTPSSTAKGPGLLGVEDNWAPSALEFTLGRRVVRQWARPRAHVDTPESRLRGDWRTRGVRRHLTSYAQG